MGLGATCHLDHHRVIGEPGAAAIELACNGWRRKLASRGVIGAAANGARDRQIAVGGWQLCSLPLCQRAVDR